MRPVYQTTFKGEVAGEETGNCLAACVASILELDIADVPNFAAIPGQDGWWKALYEFVFSYGFHLYPVHPDHGAPEGAYWIAVGKSPRGNYNHCVVAHGKEIVHDPSGKAGPFLDGLAKELYLFVALDPARSKVEASS